MSKLPEPQRERLIQALSGAFVHVDLVIEGHEVTFQAQRLKPLVYVLQPFVDGYFKGLWVMRDPEELDDAGKLCQRLMRRRVRKLYGPKRLKEINRLYRKLGKEPISKQKNETVYLDAWHCPKALVAHLEREFETIEILEPSDVTA